MQRQRKEKPRKNRAVILLLTVLILCCGVPMAYARRTPHVEGVGTEEEIEREYSEGELSDPVFWSALVQCGAAPFIYVKYRQARERQGKNEKKEKKGDI